MTDIKNFFLWFIDNLPDFLMSDPIKYFVGIFIAGMIIKLILDLCGIRSERR